MFPGPAQQAGQQAFNQSLRNQQTYNHWDAQRRQHSRRRGASGSGLGGLLKLLLVVAVVVLLVQNPELRADLWTFAQILWADARRLWAQARNG